MSLQQGWIQMIRPELHKTQPFLALLSDWSYMQLFRSLWCITRGALPGFYRTTCYIVCFVCSSVHYRLLFFFQPTIFSNAEYFSSKLTKICTAGKEETKAWAYKVDVVPTDGIYPCCRKRQKSPWGLIIKKQWEKTYSSPNLVVSLH